MSPGHHPNPFAAAAAPRPQPTPPRRSHRVLLALELLLATALALLLALWWWAGSSGSLASTLSRATHYLPEGQSLQVRSGQRSMSLSFKDLDEYVGARASRGGLLPRGWQKVDGLDVQ